MSLNQIQINQILSAINDCRTVVLHAVEFELDGSPNWDVVRSRILRAFGNKGLTGQIEEILSVDVEGGIA